MEDNNQEYQCACECCASPEQMAAMRREMTIRLIASIVLLFAGLIISEFTKLPNYVYLICYGISYMLVGFGIVRDAILGVLAGYIFNENLLMSIASLGAFAIKEYHEGCAVVILYTIGELMQQRAIEKSRRNLATDLGADHQPVQSSSEKFITKFAMVYTPIVCVISILIIVIPPLFLHGTWSEWLHRGLSALVVSCPCAIVVSVPLCFFGGIGTCSRQGIFVNDSACIEKMSKYTTDTPLDKIKKDGVAISDFSKEKLEIGIKASKKTILLAKENIIISIAVKVVILVLDVFLAKEVPMWLAAFGDVGICIIAVLNSLRAIKK